MAKCLERGEVHLFTFQIYLDARVLPSRAQVKKKHLVVKELYNARWKRKEGKKECKQESKVPRDWFVRGARQANLSPSHTHTHSIKWERFEIKIELSNSVFFTFSLSCVQGYTWITCKMYFSSSHALVRRVERGSISKWKRGKRSYQ